MLQNELKRNGFEASQSLFWKRPSLPWMSLVLFLCTCSLKCIFFIHFLLSCLRMWNKRRVETTSSWTTEDSISSNVAAQYDIKPANAGTADLHVWLNYHHRHTAHRVHYTVLLSPLVNKQDKMCLLWDESQACDVLPKRGEDMIREWNLANMYVSGLNYCYQ